MLEFTEEFPALLVQRAMHIRLILGIVFVSMCGVVLEFACGHANAHMVITHRSAHSVMCSVFVLECMCVVVVSDQVAHVGGLSTSWSVRWKAPVVEMEVEHIKAACALNRILPCLPCVW